MNKTKLAMAGLTVITGAGILIAAAPFQSKDGENPQKGKYKQYQVIHMKDGKMIEADTLIPMDSEYSVESFLKDKNIESTNLDIIKLPGDGTMENIFFADEMESDGKYKNMVIRTEIKVDHDENDSKEGLHEENVEMIVKVNESGEIEAKKIVNGKEVELTKEELEELKSHHQNHEKSNHGNNMMIRIEKDDHKKDEDLEDVQMIVKINEKGEIDAKKVVNGKEIQLTDEELKELKEEHMKMIHSGDDHHKIIRIEMDEEMEGLHKEIMEKVHGELKDLDIDFDINGLLNKDSLMDIIHRELKDLHKEIGDVKVIIKELEHDIEWNEEGNGEKVVVVQNGKKCEWQSKDGNTVMVNIDSEGGSQEDFTIVIVKEGIDKKDAETSNSISDPELDFKIFPNPSNGKFTLSFLLEKKEKTNIEVVDLQGKQVYKEDLGKIEGRIQKEIDLTQFGSGVYIL
ncbi:MAG: T9SS type A sorting domain-containing protein, partial [Crocinitomicaceae bacterium]|nr:T9SS type A sorting domain-containing protein [Crocinitomicaceae bacterium]